MIDGVTGAVVEKEDRVRGYEIGKDEYLQVEEEDLDAVKLDTRRTIDIDLFVPVEQLDGLYMGDNHYLMPDDEVAVEAFAVIREAMVRTETAGIARLTMNNRERWIAVQPRGKGILLTTLKYSYEIRDENVVWERIDDEKPDAEAVKAMEEVMDEMAADWNPKEFVDRYQEALSKVLKEKQKGHKVQPLHIGGPKVTAETKASSLMERLRKSIEQEKEEKRPKAGSKTRAAKGKTRAA